MVINKKEKSKDYSETTAEGFVGGRSEKADDSGNGDGTAVFQRSRVFEQSLEVFEKQKESVENWCFQGFSNILSRSKKIWQ